MGIGGSTQNNLQQLRGLLKKATGFRQVSPGTREYAESLVKGLEREYPRGWDFVVKKESLTREKLVSLYLHERYKFRIWMKMMTWVEYAAWAEGF